MVKPVCRDGAGGVGGLGQGGIAAAQGTMGCLRSGAATWVPQLGEWRCA